MADNGFVFVTQHPVSDVTGIKVMGMTPAQPGDQVMTAHAVNTVTGETVDGSVTLDPSPPTCGH